MPVRVRAVLFVVVAFGITAAAVAACSSRSALEDGWAPSGASSAAGRDAAPGAIGAVGVELTLSGGEHISTIAYSLSNAHNTYAGTYAIADADTTSFVIGSVAADMGYSLTLSATSDDGKVTCAFPAPGDPLVANIAVANRTTTVVSVNMQCVNRQGLDAGSVLVNALTSNCPAWNTIVVNPPDLVLDSASNVNDAGDAGSTAIFPGSTSVPATLLAGQSAVVVGSATAPNPGAVTFAWSTTGGTLSSPTGTLDPNGTGQPNGQTVTRQTIFTCPATGAGSYTITLGLSDGMLPEAGGCDPQFTTGSVTVNCQAPPPCLFGTGCGDGGQICNAAGACVQALFSVVVLTGIDGGAVDKTGKYLPVSIQKFDLSGNPVGSPLALPVAVNGSNQPITMAGNNITEGDLTTSADGRLLVTAGWNVVPNGNPRTTSNLNPVVATIDTSGHVDTSTTVSGAYVGLSVRSAVTTDGGAFWVSGSSTDSVAPSSGGIWYVLAHTAFSRQLESLPALDGITPDYTSNWLRIAAGQLFAGFEQPPQTPAYAVRLPFLATVGTGEPTTGAPPLTNLPGGFQTWTGATPSPYGFAMFDLFSSPGTIDTVYVADDGINPDGTTDTAPSNGTSGSTLGGGLSKWSYSPSTGWSRIWNVSAGTWAADAGIFSNAPIGFRGLAGFATGSTVTLMATTASNQGNPDSLAVLFVDNGGSSPPTPSVVRTSPTSQVYRGVALTPQ